MTEETDGSWTSYPKIYALGHKALEGLTMTEDGVEVEEKIDGSQFSFGVFGGELRMRSRSVQLHELEDENGEGGKTDYNGFGLAVATVKRLHAEGKLVNGWTYRGEFLSKPKHNALAYERAPGGNIILFDVATGKENYLDWNGVRGAADALGLECVPLLSVGVKSFDHLNELLAGQSCLGGMIEGVVIKNRANPRFDRDGKPVMGKFVSERFKEIHRKAWGESNPGPKDIISKLVGGLRAEARWEKAIFRLRDAGLLDESPKDIGALIKSVQQDIVDECADELKDMLWNHFRRDILGKSTSGIPQWYKDRLAMAQFGEGDEERQDG